MRTRAAFVAAWRSLVSAPANTVAVALALTFAVGAWHAVGSVRDSVIGRGLPYRDPDTLVALNASASDSPFDRFLSDREAALLRERSESFAWVGHLWGGSMNLGDPPVRTVSAAALEPGFLEAFGAAPRLGRPFRPEDHEGEARPPSAPFSPDAVDQGQPVVLLGRDLWRTAFGSTPEAVGAEIVLDGRPMRVIGVMPADFFTPTLGSELWVPARRREVGTGPGGPSRTASAYARLRPGVSPAAAAAEASNLLSTTGFREPDAPVQVVPLSRALTASVRPTLEILRAGALVLLLAAAVSVSGLRLARSRAGRRAAAVRRALGASFRDEFLAALFRVVLLAAAVTGGSAGLAGLALPIFRRYGAELPFAEGWTASWGVAGEAFAAALLTAALAEAAPLLDTLRTRDRSAGMARFHVPRRRRAIPPTLTLGVAAATVILVATTVIGGSAWRLFAGRGGYPDRGLAQITVDFAGHAGGAALPHAERLALLNRLIERVEAIPAVQSAAYADALPDQMGGMVTFTTAGPNAPRDRDSGRAVRSVSPELLPVLGIPLIAGRGITEADTPEAERVMVVDRSWARASELSNPVGAMVRSAHGESRVVGVVPDLRVFPDISFFPTAYVPFAVPPPLGSHAKVEVVARFREGPTAEQVAALGRLPAEVDPVLRATSAVSVRDHRIRRLGAPLLAAVALGVFAAAGLLLAIVGGIGHIADSVIRQAHANAVRTALGADPDLLVWGAFRPAALAAVAGVSLGTFLGWLLSRAVAARVAWIETGDPMSYLGPAALLLCLMLAASAFAGLRALRGDPWAALRSL